MSVTPFIDVSSADLPEWVQSAVLRVWQQGFDTLEIAKHFGMAEFVISRVIAADQDRRHAERVLVRPA